MLGEGTRAVWDIAEKARAEGLSYGQYVALHQPIPAPKVQEQAKTRVCGWCGRTFTVGSRGTRQKYCSLPCAAAVKADDDRRRKNRLYKHKYELGPDKSIKVTCKYCGKEVVQGDTGRVRYYCDKRCRDRAFKQRERERCLNT